jgi:hypothetical protein
MSGGGLFAPVPKGDKGVAVARFTAMVDAERRAIVQPQGVPAEVLHSNAALHPSRSHAFVLRPLTVCVRKRPLNRGEAKEGQFDILTAAPPTHKEVVPRTVVLHEPRTKYDLTQSVVNHAFSFDRAFGDECGTGEVYASVLSPLVATLDKSAQFTVFAYGQTGSGKSYTMGGLTERAIEDVMKMIHSPSNRHR